MFFIGHQGEEFAYIVNKAHIQHTVGLVQYQDIKVAKISGSLVNVIK